MKISSQSVTALAALVALTPTLAYMNVNVPNTAFQKRSLVHRTVFPVALVSNPKKKSSLFATVEEIPNTESDSGLDESILSRITDATAASKQWAEMFDLSSESGAAFHALFSGIRSSANLGLKGKPFHLKSSDVLKAMGEGSDTGAFSGFFSFDDLSKALKDDFLDADRGSTDNRQGWKVTAVSTPRGSSFEDARMTLDEVNSALAKGTVIFNTAGSHIPKLAGATLACTDASALPCALNMYVTSAGKRTSAPPHTDRQDVIVVQTQGQKHWRVYSPPEPSIKPDADMYARGKGDDNLPLYSLEEGSFGCKKLVDVILEAGDVLFIPAAFPHTTDTVSDLEDVPENASIHLTFNFDTHVWDLSYLSARRLALRRAGIDDSALGQNRVDESQYVGNVNMLNKDTRTDLLSNLPLDFLDEFNDAGSVETVTVELERISKEVDEETYNAVPSAVWKETVEELQKQGMQLFDIHRDMYLAAVDEGRERKREEDMTAHLTGDSLTRARAMTPEKMQRLSLFRVQKYFEQITETKESLSKWSMEGAAASASGNDPSSGALPDDWPFTLPVKVGDQVEADLGGAFFPATVTKAGNTYDVKFFDGDVMNGLDRSMVKLLTPPVTSSSDGNSSDEDSPPPGLTKKELKKWRKKQEKARAKKGF